MTDDLGVVRQVEAALDYAQGALAAVRGMPGSQNRVDAAKLLSTLRSIADDATNVLREEAWRMYTTEGLTLGSLAQRLGVSKARAHQFVQEVQKKQAAAAEATARERLAAESQIRKRWAQTPD